MRSLLGAAIEEEADVTVVDMEAGLEHLSRSGGTLAYADALLVVMEPTRKSILTGSRTVALAEELGIPRTYGVGNKARLPDDAEFFRTVAAEFGVPLAGVIPFDPDVVESDRLGTRMAEERGELVRTAVDEIVDFLESPQQERDALLKERERLDKRLADLQSRD